MHQTTITIPIYLPRRLVRPLRGVRNAFRLAFRKKYPSANLLGDRDVEWSWIASHIPAGPGEALDFGHGGSYLALIAAHRGFRVTAVDLQRSQRPYVHANLSFIQGDLLTLPLPVGKFDLVINCSTVEHVGLAGRFSITESVADGDLRAMTRLRDLMKPGGIMLLTIPVGRDAVFAPMCRVYGGQRLPQLLDGYSVTSEGFWVKDTENRWCPVDRQAALAFEAYAGSRDPLRNVYALGCFVLLAPKVESCGGGQGTINRSWAAWRQPA